MSDANDPTRAEYDDDLDYAGFDSLFPDCEHCCQCPLDPLCDWCGLCLDCCDCDLGAEE